MIAFIKIFFVSLPTKINTVAYKHQTMRDTFTFIVDHDMQQVPVWKLMASFEAASNMRWRLFINIMINLFSNVKYSTQWQQ